MHRPSPARRPLLASLLLAPLAFPGQPPAPAAAQLPGDRSPTLERLYSLPSLIGTAPRQPVWSPDGRRLAFLWNDEGQPFLDVWMWSAEEPGSPVRLTRMGGREAPMSPSPGEGSAPTSSERAYAAAVEEEGLERDQGVGSISWSPGGRELLVGFRGDLWTVVPGGEPERLTATPERESVATYAPGGGPIAFLRDGDLWLLPQSGSAGEGGRAEGGKEAIRLTRFTDPAVGVTSYRWSPGGDRIAILVADAAEVPVRGIPDYLSDETELRMIRRPYPGEATARPRLGVLEVTGATAARAPLEPAWASLEAREGGAPDMILDYRWSPDGRRLAIDTGDWTAKDRRIFLAEAEGGTVAVRLAYREADPENETYYFWRIAWAPDGDELFLLSDRREDYHVWALDMREVGREPRQVTSGPWAVASMDPREGALFVVGNRGAGEERHLFHVDPVRGELRRITRRPGTHTPSVSPDGRYAAVLFSSDDMPPDLWVLPLEPGALPAASATAEGGAAGWRITDSPLPEFDDYRWVAPEYVTFRSHVDGTTLHGRLTLPPDFDPTRRYPAILGSVYTDVVRNQWGGRTAHPTWGLDQVLAREGYVLLTVDVRGSWGRGREHRRGIRLDYGGMDIEDLESGVRFLGTLGYVDLDRVGIWGSSYGGLMTAMSLFRKPGLYAAGIAGAPATNVWHALSGQMAVMRSPEESPAEYADSSPFMHADGLQDPLMIIHGMQDRIVLFKDSMTLVQRLILLGKDVDLVALPASGHGWDLEGLAQTRFAFRKMLDFFDRHLKGGGS